MVFVDLTSHPELSCCSNKTTYVGGDTVKFNLEGLSEGTTYTVNVYAENLVGKGSGKQDSFTTGWLAVLPRKANFGFASRNYSIYIYGLLLSLSSLHLSLS